MPGPIAKPDGQRRRRNEPKVPTLKLSADGRHDDPPEPVEVLNELENEYYTWAWSTPAANAWHESDAEIVAEWARLKAYATRCLRGEIKKTTATGLVIPADLRIGMLEQITSREDRLMLSPIARSRGHAQISEPPSEHDGNVVTPGRWSK
jgi:hypothetical protein